MVKKVVLGIIIAFGALIALGAMGAALNHNGGVNPDSAITSTATQTSNAQTASTAGTTTQSHTTEVGAGDTSAQGTSINLLSSSAHGARLEILPNHSGYPTEILFSFYRITGEVVNTGDKPATNIEVTAKLYDASGTLVGSASTRLVPPHIYLYETTLQPGSKVPFQIDFDNKDISKIVQRYELSVQYDEGITKSHGLAIASSQFFKSGSSDFFKYDEWSVTGEIRNDGTKDASGVYIFGSLYDGSGKVVGVVGTFDPDGATNPLPAGSTRPFSYTTKVPQNTDVKSIYLYAESKDSVAISPE